MKTWVVRFLSLYAFNIVVLLLIGLLTPARVGIAAIWASVVLTVAEIVVKPLAQRAFQRAAAKSAAERTRASEWLVQAGIVLVVAAIVWVLTLLLSGISVRGWLWAYVLPPVIIAVGWLVYARIDDIVEARTGQLYDSAFGRRSGGSADSATAPATEPGTGTRARQDLDDGLTPEQRRMLDELGKS
ncbi:hypothetical protein [Microbacterium dextranolyticum]|uniref:Uncharacterized protein n=1 Tax=Microbacterium dextranolyticum TaxID=36806 RepID=A0A9W6HKV0_9MICO|nr:hypothetical protein [Microbacterium dextranolyticum]MBM7463831.1 sterol desaturase/sphingolipid hydroxylase (fatty acid hydroxylase superfamily) [Microbacterium dextranolyticum]GLJ94913.1 hypothetical protein GCM10017591_09750 [Microbacterium dextranolyticum]